MRLASLAFVLIINMHDLVRLCEHETQPRRRPRPYVSELARQFYESGSRNSLRRQSDCEPNTEREPRA